MLTILPKENAGAAVRALMDEGGVVAPIERDGEAIFARLRDSTEARLDAKRTLHSAKTALLPARDPFLRFDLVGATWETIPLDAPRFLLGLHPCDVWAHEAFDLWMNEGVPDDRYDAAESAVTIIALKCAEPCGEDCFCGAMGTWRPRAFDILMTDDGDRYLLEAASDHGRHVLHLWNRWILFSDASAEKRHVEILASAEKAFAGSSRCGTAHPFRIDELPAAMKRAFHAPWWHDMAERCLDCGQCVAVCPTCTCFAMTDECDFEMKECIRCRVTDGCMFAPFAEVAGGHNFRRDRYARIRHRMNRKGNWLNERFSIPFCVGCGRCVTTCPVEISPWKVFRRACGEAIDV